MISKRVYRANDQLLSNYFSFEDNQEEMQGGEAAVAEGEGGGAPTGADTAEGTDTGFSNRRLHNYPLIKVATLMEKVWGDGGKRMGMEGNEGVMEGGKEG